ncbi:hypothetical protein [Vandammella animalimorsus]|uniref:hypothetical protein n=1 Tax=Vandammella animalimorsus TaxID=2029117 RepID=UPI001EEDBEC7|nr:hypothetical protein [Vandammella animalimorsus]
MLAKLTAQNQIPLPKAAVSAVDAAEYFDVQVENGRIVLTPVRMHQAQVVRDQLQRFGHQRAGRGRRHRLGAARENQANGARRRESWR